MLMMLALGLGTHSRYWWKGTDDADDAGFGLCFIATGVGREG